jgi:hypothetical protein
MTNQQQDALSPGEAPPPPHDTTPQEPPTPPRRRTGRRIGIALVVLLVLVLLVIGAAPYLVGTGLGTNFVLSLVNGRIAGAVQLQSLNLSWSGPTTLCGLRVLDPAQREVLQVDRITAAPGVWRLLTGPLNFGDVAVNAPQAALYIDAENEVSLAQAFQPRQPTPPKAEPGPLPELHGRVVIEGGTVQVFRDSGASYELNDLGAALDLRTLGDLSGELRLTFPDGAKLAAQAEVRDLVADGRLQPAQANGKLSVATDGAIELGPVTRLLAPRQAVNGTLTINLQAAGTPDELQAEFALAVRQLQTAERADTGAAPVDLEVAGRAERKGDAIAADADLTGAAGTASTKLSYRLAPQPIEISAEQVLSAILTGERIDLPEFTLDVQGQLDLAKLEQAVPNLLKVGEGRALTAGRLEIAQVSVRGGQEPSASGSVTLTELAVVNEGRAAQLEPVSVDFDLALREGSGLQIARANLKSSFADVQAAGNASDLRATCRGRLGQLRQDVGELFDLGDLELAGELSSELRLQRTGDERVDITLDAAVKDLRLARGDKRFDLAHMTLQQAGSVTLADRAITRLDVSSAEADLDGRVLVATAGWYELRKQGFHVDAHVKQADLGFVGTRAQALGAAELGRYGGALVLQTTANRPGADQPIGATGSLTARKLTLDGQPLVEGDATLVWTNVQVTPQTPRIQAEAVGLDSTVAKLDAKDARWQGGESLDLSAAVKGSADLARLMQIIAAVMKLEEPPAIAGNLALDSQLATAKEVVSLTARGGVDNLVIGTGEQTFREKRLDFDLDGKIEQRQERLALSRLKLTSAPLSAEISGRVDQYRTDRRLALKGRYDASWEQLTRLLHELAPATAKTVVVAGKSTSEFEIAGPLQQPGAKPPFRDLKTGLSIGWKSAELYGVAMGAGKLSPTLAKGKLTLPRTAIPAGDGKVNIGGVVDFAPQDPTLSVAGKLQVLESVPLTPRVADLLLSWINPIFAKLARIEGRVNLSAADVHVPVNAAITTKGNAKGVLDLQKVKLQPAGFFGELAGLAGVGTKELTPVTFGKLDFVLKDGRILYDNLTLTLPDALDLKFRGSVGLDGTLDLVVSIPVRGPLLDKLGVKGPAADVVKQADLRLDIPIVGTREKPRIDLSKVDKEKLLKQLLVPAAPQKALEDLLKRPPAGEKGEKKGGR